MARGTRIGLQHATVNREPGLLRKVEIGRFLHHLFTRQYLGADAVQSHDVGAADQSIQCCLRARGKQVTPWRKHDVVVQVFRQITPQRHRMLVERRVVLHHVIGAHDGGVATHVARADVALLKDGDVADAMVPGQVIRRGQAVPTATNDDNVVGFFGLRVTPRALPSLVPAHGVLEQGPNRISLAHIHNLAHILMRLASGSNGGSICRRAGRRSPRISISNWMPGLINSVGK